MGFLNHENGLQAPKSLENVNIYLEAYRKLDSSLEKEKNTQKIYMKNPYLINRFRDIP